MAATTGHLSIKVRSVVGQVSHANELVLIGPYPDYRTLGAEVNRLMRLADGAAIFTPSDDDYRGADLCADAAVVAKATDLAGVLDAMYDPTEHNRGWYSADVDGEWVDTRLTEPVRKGPALAALHLALYATGREHGDPQPTAAEVLEGLERLGHTVMKPPYIRAPDYALQLRAAILEAEEEALDRSEARRFFAMGLRVAAGLFGLPEGVDPETRRRLMPDPMPVFTILARDLLALNAVAAYRDLCEQAGLTDQAAQVTLALAEMLEWRQRHSDAVKAPDHKHRPIRD